MSSEVRELCFRSLLTETKDGEWGKDAYFTDSVKMAVIRGTDFDRARNSTVTGVPVRFIARKNAARKTLKPYDILIETAGGSKGRPTGKTVLLRPTLFESTPLPITCASFARFLRIDAAIANPEYVYWYLQHLYANGVIENHQVQHTGIARFQFTKFADSVNVPLPSLTDQAEVARLLAFLDDRITLLRETNATLEAIAQALFKSWFVDFDPVRAKMDGRIPEGMDEATAALFPVGFEESELGLVPNGWQVGKVGDYARQHKGSIYPLQNPEVLYEHFSLPAFDNQQMPVAELGTEIKSNKTSVPPDAVLLSKLNPHIPRIWLPVEAGHHAVCSTEFLVFVPALDSGASKEFIYCAFTTAKFKELLCQLVTGTSNSHQRVKPDGVSTMSAVIPCKVTLEAFGSIVKPIFERIGHNRSQAATLATLRDTVLPRLIAGQLRLPEAAAITEKVTA